MSEELFIYFDVDKINKVKNENLLFMLRATGYLVADTEQILKQMDPKNTGYFDRQGFQKACTILKDCKPKVQEITNSLNIFDVNQSGFVDTQELMNIVQQMGDVQGEKELQHVLNQVKDKDHKVSMQSLIDLLMTE
ncbi:hypothetical protein pb186bvf_009175 [Paramecium bursaria]